MGHMESRGSLNYMQRDNTQTIGIFTLLNLLIIYSGMHNQELMSVLVNDVCVECRGACRVGDAWGGECETYNPRY